MAKTRTKLADKLGKRAHQFDKEHKGKEVQYDTGGSLPEGIEGGVAQLTTIKIGEFERGANEGEPYFMAMGTVIQPKEVNGTPIEGLYTQIGPEPICDTPGRSRPEVEDHLEWVCNELGKLLGHRDFSVDEIEEMCELLQEEKPYFRFRTWKGSKQDIVEKGGKYYVGNKVYRTAAAAKAANPFVGTEPRVQQTWNGIRGLEHFSLDGEEAVEDASEEVEETDTDTTEVEEEVETEEPEEVEAEADDTETETDDLLAIAEEADNGDEEAAAKIAEAAEALGMDSEDYEDWKSCAEAVLAAGEGGEEEEAETEEQQSPEKGDVYFYKPKGKRKAVECEVTVVFSGKETCNLKSLDDGKSYKSVKWEALLDSAE